ncbi:hypothetical protein [Nodosilinea nodulosa]|uniref:hypothetical protein n=1 Tax=Nodosilinea nodulosa TaxID=416001 RepID=UPI0002EEF47D|nr:hypothetical protein [Nodosilinea nodulosa]
MPVITFKAPIENGIIEIREEYKEALLGTDQVEMTILTQCTTAKTGLIAELIEHPTEVDEFIL